MTVFLTGVFPYMEKTLLLHVCTNKYIFHNPSTFRNSSLKPQSCAYNDWKGKETLKGQNKSTNKNDDNKIYILVIILLHDGILLLITYIRTYIRLFYVTTAPVKTTYVLLTPLVSAVILRYCVSAVDLC